MGLRGLAIGEVMNTASSAPRTVPEALTRTLRHEIGDLLQTLYATVAILQRRLPADWSQERRVLADLRTRAEACKHLLDIAHDYACPVALTPGAVDLNELTARLTCTAQRRFPQLEIKIDSQADCTLTGDEARLAQTGEILLNHACESAGKRVLVEVNCGPDEAIWSFTDDGTVLAGDQQQQLFTMYSMTRRGRPTLGLALAQRLIALHGGRIETENTRGSLRVSAHLPRAFQQSEAEEATFTPPGQGLETTSGS
jgi:signal transduction histidine kinase